MAKNNDKREKNNKVKANLLTASGKSNKQINLPTEIFGAKINESLLAQAISVYRDRRHQRTKAVKTRGEVRGSTRKIYRQKGTGRARHGDIKAPIFVGGGVAHGPKKAGAKPVLSKKQRRGALFAALASQFSEGNIIFLDYDFSKLPSRTKAIVKLLTNIGLENKDLAKTLLVLKEIPTNVLLATRNIQGLTIMQANLLNAYEVLRFQKLVIAKDAIPVLEETFKL